MTLAEALTTKFNIFDQGSSRTPNKPRMVAEEAQEKDQETPMGNGDKFLERNLGATGFHTQGEDYHRSGSDTTLNGNGYEGRLSLEWRQELFSV